MNSQANGAAVLVAAALALAGGSTIAQDNSANISWATGLEYATGTYGGTEDIEELYLPINVRADFDRVSVSITVPYLSVQAPAGSTLPDIGGELIDDPGTVTTESGLGDVIASATVYDVFYSDNYDVALDLTGKIKFGTADLDKGLGTGEHDYTMRADLYKFFDGFTLMGSAGYKWRGDPAGVDLDDVMLGSIGGLFSVSEKSRIGVFYDYRESAIPGNDAVSEVSVLVSRHMSENWQIQFYGFTGFSDSSVDWGTGFILAGT